MNFDFRISNPNLDIMYATKFLTVIISVSFQWISAESAATFGIPGMEIPELKLTTQACQTAVLAAHNALRRCEGVGLLVLNASLTNAAQNWANNLCTTGDFYHDPNQNIGQNLYWQSNNPTANLCEGVASWYSECVDYAGDGNIGYAGHFTQLLWRGSTQLGVGCCQAPNSVGGGYYLVADYYPPGNYEGEVTMNVPSKSTCSCKAGC